MQLYLFKCTMVFNKSVYFNLNVKLYYKSIRLRKFLVLNIVKSCKSKQTHFHLQYTYFILLLL